MTEPEIIPVEVIAVNSSQIDTNPEESEIPNSDITDENQKQALNVERQDQNGTTVIFETYYEAFYKKISRYMIASFMLCFIQKSFILALFLIFVCYDSHTKD